MNRPDRVLLTSLEKDKLIDLQEALHIARLPHFSVPGIPQQEEAQTTDDDWVKFYWAVNATNMNPASLAELMPEPDMLIAIPSAKNKYVFARIDTTDSTKLVLTVLFEGHSGFGKRNRGAVFRYEYNYEEAMLRLYDCYGKQISTLKKHDRRDGHAKYIFIAILETVSRWLLFVKQFAGDMDLIVDPNVRGTKKNTPKLQIKFASSKRYSFSFTRPVQAKYEIDEKYLMENEVQLENIDPEKDLPYHLGDAVRVWTSRDNQTLSDFEKAELLANTKVFTRETRHTHWERVALTPHGCQQDGPCDLLGKLSFQSQSSRHWSVVAPDGVEQVSLVCNHHDEDTLTVVVEKLPLEIR